MAQRHLVRTILLHVLIILNHTVCMVCAGPNPDCTIQDAPTESDEGQLLKLTIKDSMKEPCALSRGSLMGVLQALQVLE